LFIVIPFLYDCRTAFLDDLLFDTAQISFLD
jgi:hypothetical protein